MFTECIFSALIYFLSVIAENEISDKKDETSTDDYIPCEKSWYFFRDKCYKLGGKKRTGRLSWNKASDKCKTDGGALVTIDSKELQDFLVTFPLLDAETNAWIGLHDQFRDSAFVWEDGSSPTYTNWEPNEPSGSGYFKEKEDCVEMVFNSWKGPENTGKWNDVECKAPLAYICQAPRRKQLKKTPDPRFCPGTGGGWKYRDSCYFVEAEKKSWNDAESHCREKFNGHLVMIPNYRVDSFLNHILSLLNTEIWIGIKLQEHKTLFEQKWTSGWRVAYSDFSWDHGDFVDGTCTVRSDPRTWTTNLCTKKYSFVCETSNDKPPALKSAPKGTRCPETPEDWLDLGGEYCYYFDMTNHYTGYRANFECITRGGFLTSIHSLEESDTLRHYVRHTQRRIFIGLYRPLGNEDLFLWMDGSRLDWENWDTAEPSSVDERCVELWTDTMKWQDANCTEIKGFICSAKKGFKIMNGNATENNANSDCSGYISYKTLIGVTVCILLVFILIGVVVYFLRPCNQDKKKQLSTSINFQPAVPSGERPKYRTSTHFIIQEDNEYEHMN